MGKKSKKKPNDLADSLRGLTPPKPDAELLADQQLLLPDNPGEDLLEIEEWVAVAAALHLSGRQLSIAMLITLGHERKAIAQELRSKKNRPLSVNTVRTFIDRLYRKVNVQDARGLMLRLMRVYLQLKEQNRLELS